MPRQWTIFVCHECGFIVGEEQESLKCWQCGADRDAVEEVDVVEEPRTDAPDDLRIGQAESEESHV